MSHLTHPRWTIALCAVAILGLAGTLGAYLGLTGSLPAYAQRGPIMAVEPGGGSRDVWPGTSIAITFDRAVDQASVEAALSVEPAAPGTFVWRENRVELRPREPLAPQTSYKVTLGTGARDAGGRQLLTTPFTWSFTGSAWNQSLSFGWGLPVQLIAPGGKFGAGLNPPYPRITLDFALYALDVPGFARRYAALDPNAGWGEQKKIDVAGLAEVKRWSAHIDNSEGTTGIRLPKDVPPGLYVLDARHARSGDAQALVIYNDHTLVAKQGRKAGLTLWAAGLLDGQPAGGAQVKLVDAKGQPVADQSSDGDGIARFGSAAGAAFAVATVDGHPTLVGLDANWRTSDGYWRWWGGGWSVEAPEFAGHVHTDRPIYRPGHVVHYKASLRRFTGEGLAVVDAAMPVTVTLRDARGNLIAQSQPRADAFGSVAGEVKLGDEVALGDWHFEVQVGRQVFYDYIKVEDYVKPDYEVTIGTDRPFYIRGESALVAVRADYYFGQPAVGADLTLRVYRGYYWRGSGLTPIETLTGVLGADGGWTGTVKLPGNESYTEPFSFEAEVTDASRRPVVSETSVPVHPAAFTLELTSDRYGVEVGQPVIYTARTMGHDGQPAGGRKVDIELRQWQREGYDVVKKAQVTTGADGTAPVRFDGLREGWYNVVATAADAAGRQVQTTTYAWLYSEAYPWYWWGGLELETDKPSYAPGDTVRLLVKSPVTTTALVTIERDDVHEELVVPVKGGTTVEVPVKPEYAPNVWVKVQLWKPSDNPYDWHEGQLLTATKLVSVPATDKRLSVEVLPDAATHAPGEEATFTLRVRDAAGRPVDAQVSLALVDKAVLALAPDRSGPIYDAFWGEWQNAVRTWSSAEIGQTYRGGLEDAAGPGGGRPPSPGRATAPGQDKSNEAVPPAPRREFRDTAYWNATITTGPDGEAQVSLTLPDNLTTWQALARAITKASEVGQGSAELVVTQPIIADPALPRFAVQGDQFTLDVLGRNYAGGTLDGTCVLETPGLVQLDPGDRSLSLPFNETRSARWSVVASQVGVGTVKAQLTTPKGADAIELPLEVQPFTVPDRFVISGATTATTDEKFDVPFNAVPDSSTVEIRLAPGMALGVLDGIEDLVGYPYGCVEQTMSKVLPNAVVARLIQAVHLDAPEITAKLPEYMDVGLQKLYGFQNTDGSWGWWGGAEATGNIYTTAYVLYGLAMVKEAGFTVEPNVQQRGLDWLAAAVQNEKDPRLQAYAGYVLAVNDREDVALAQALFDQRGKLDAFGLAALAVTLSTLGEIHKADQALDDLVARAKTTPTSAWWPLSDVPDWTKWDDYHWRSMASSEKNTAMALEALATLRPRDPLAPKAAAWLLEHRWGKAWPSTQATAFAILALTDHIVASGELTSDYAWTVRLDGVQVAQGRVDRGNVTGRIPPVVLTGPSLAPGPHVISFEKQGAGTLYYTVLGQMALYYPSFAATEAEGVGIQIKREYTPISGRSDAGGWHVGDVVNVRLTVDVGEDLHYALVEDRLPAGLEGLNESLGTESTKVPSDPEPGVPGRMPPWRWWGYERKEVHDDHVTFFASYLPAGTHVFEYAARAITPGTFAARPAEAYAMYRPEVWGRSASDQVAIDAERVAQRPVLAGDFDRDCRLTSFDASLVAADWAGGKGRDVTGDGTVSVADIATAAGRAGKQCGDDVPPRPGSAGGATLGLRAPGAVRLGETFEIELVLDAAGKVGAYEATLKLPAGMFEVVGLANGARVPGAYVLGPDVDTAGGATTVRVGGWASRGAEGSGGQVLARLKLRATAVGDAPIDVTGAEVVTDQGGAYTVTATGTRLAPALWEPVAKVWLPVAQQQR